MFNTAKEIREFTLAGNATITLESQKTGAHFTYRVRQATDKNDKPTNRWFVSVMNGPDNESSFAYIGLIDAGARQANFLDPNGPVQFRQTAKSRFGPDTPSVRGFVFFWHAIVANKTPCSMNVRHEGKCGCCNRKLTTPESLDSGIGPVCAERMGTPRRVTPSCGGGAGVMAALENSLREYAL